MTIYTDGANRGNGKEHSIGGWAFIVVENDTQVYYSSEISKDTTNNREELKAVINAMKFSINRGIGDPIIHTDSQYVQKGITEWINKWQNNYWKTSDKKPVKNKDLWMELLTLEQECTPQYIWVHGHADDKWNNECDKLLNEAIDLFLKNQ